MFDWKMFEDDDDAPAPAAPPAPAPAYSGATSAAAAPAPSGATRPGLRELAGLPPKPISSPSLAPALAPAPAPEVAPDPAPELAHQEEPPALPSKGADEPLLVASASALRGASTSLDAILRRGAQRSLQSAGVHAAPHSSTKQGKRPATGPGGRAGKAPTARAAAPAAPAARAAASAARAPATSAPRPGSSDAGAARPAPSPIDEEEAEDEGEEEEWYDEDPIEEYDDEEEEVYEEEEAEPGRAEQWPKLEAQPCAPFAPLQLGERPKVPEGSVYSKTAELNANVNQYLRDYQRKGVEWLWKQYTAKRGGILGDEMGLGKTVQIAGFLSAVMGKAATSDDKMRSFPLPEKDCRQALVVVPKSTLSNWQRELQTWGWFKVQVFHGGAKAQDAALRSARERECEVMLTTYDLVRSKNNDICAVDWEVTIWDEVHQIKNPKSATNKACMRVPCKCRYGLTGTPMSNEYKECVTRSRPCCRCACAADPEILGSGLFTAGFGHSSTLPRMGALESSRTSPHATPRH